jgi:hypothetical protein
MENMLDKNAVGLIQKIANVKKIVGAIKKDGVNPYLKNRYATLNNVITALESALEEQGLLVLPQPVAEGLNTRIIDRASGARLSSFVPYKGDLDMQKLGSAITYARRYSLITIFNLECEDDDGNGASGVGAKKTDVDAVRNLTPAEKNLIWDAPDEAALKKICGELKKKAPQKIKAIMAAYLDRQTELQNAGH